MKKPPSGSKSTTDWELRFNCNREPEIKVLEKAFAGIPAGARMLVVTPSLVDAAVDCLAIASRRLRTLWPS